MKTYAWLASRLCAAALERRHIELPRMYWSRQRLPGHIGYYQKDRPALYAGCGVTWAA
jgi:hypothetical protein